MYKFWRLWKDLVWILLYNAGIIILKCALFVCTSLCWLTFCTSLDSVVIKCNGGKMDLNNKFKKIWYETEIFEMSCVVLFNVASYYKDIFIKTRVQVRSYCLWWTSGGQDTCWNNVIFSLCPTMDVVGTYVWNRFLKRDQKDKAEVYWQ